MALYDHSANKICAIHDMPTFEIKGKRKINLSALVSTLDSYLGQIKFAVVEEVGAMPGQGVTSMFNFGFSTGLITGVIASQYIPIHTVRPAIWKTLMGLGRDKDESRRRASQLFPQDAPLFSRKKDDGRAEAALLAVFASTRF